MFVILVELVGGAIGLLIIFGPAWLAGRAIARNWKPWWHAALWMLPYAAGLRFLRYALFHGELLSAEGYALTACAAIVVACTAHRIARVRQMTSQYPWLYGRAGPLRWRRVKADPATESAPA